ncbi:potassium-transporting ATPase subunit KdpA [Corynebacterium poyangense]|uniref:Potassium-transporting ATPase potassium-binding subunit n=1 Tax=Corynebacterium poyangense TaxID=2684405 RepID=A0A7H0SQ58_9CORY|nr:potassium-transporting ATPase subunit KdpA [Corynebacterium poyangense]MBZ8178378.1 potassium-transporting ATPase subunit KdpA [Corynebacterium poyangense]QNQ90683.1 potassium-transporting ATPase subunit KdpA [Corynebacterium poyangense]
MQLSPLVAVLGQIALLVILLGLAYVPLGDWMARVYSSAHHTRAERLCYRFLRIDPDTDQTWKGYFRAVLGFSIASVIVLYAIQRLQAILPSWGNPQPAVSPAMAFNTAASFVSNTNWQSYSGEDTLTNFTQAAGLGVQNFVSAAVGMAVAIALVRGIAFHRQVGNFWVDLVRGISRILLPGASIIAILLVFGGVIQTFGSNLTSSFGVTIPRALVASQEAIKELGTNGGGIFGANSSHPFENPNAWTNLLEIFSLLVIPLCLIRTYGSITRRPKDSLTLLSVVIVLWGTILGLMTWAQWSSGSWEGIEQRFGLGASTLFATSTTATSTGAVNSMHDSLDPAAGGLALLNMLLGEVSPGGVGAGLYGLLIVAILAVFVGGLLVGRTPEFAGKRITQKEITAACLYILVMPGLVLAGTAITVLLPDTIAALTNNGPAGSAANAHGLTEILYAFTSAANNNGSAFAGLDVTGTWFQLALGVTMLVGRFLPIYCVLMLAGSLAQQQRRDSSAGTLPTYGISFAALVIGIVVLVSALTFFPVLCLGPISEALA